MDDEQLLKILLQLQGDMKEMKGGLQEFKDQTNRQFEEVKDRLNDGDRNFSEIKRQLAERPVCRFHQTIDAAVAQDKQRINDLEKQDIRIEAKLSPQQEKQLDNASTASKAATLGAVLLGLWEIVKLLLKLP